MRKRIIIAVVAIAVLGGSCAALQLLRRGRGAPSQLQTATVRRGPLVATVSTAGAIQTASSVDLAFRISGQVKQILVEEGDQVASGQEIAILDTADAELGVAQAEAGLVVAQARLEQAKEGATVDEIASAQAALASAEEALKALQAGPTASDIEVARLRWEQAKDQLWSAQVQRDATCGNPMASSASKDQSKAAVAAAEMAAEIARVQYEQAQQGATDQELRAAEAQVAQARTNLAQLTAGASASAIRVAEGQLKQAEITLAQAKLSLDQAHLKAPFAGTLTDLDLEIGQMVGPTSVVGTLSGPGGLEIVADMSEVDVARVRPGQPAEITLDALPESTFKGHVAAVAASGQSAQGVVNFPVTIALDDTDPAIRPGMTANAAIVVEQRENVLLVPSRAIRTQGGKYLVRVLRGAQIEEVTIRVGLSGDGTTEILGDTLREGDVVVTSMPSILEASMRGGQGPMMGD